MVERFARDWRSAGLPESTQVVLGFSEKLTRHPSEMSRSDVEGLRRVGFGDEDIHDIVQITAFFNYINRVADALGIPPEPEMKPWARRDS